MTAPRDPTLAMLIALAHGGTLAEIAERTGRSERTAQNRLRALEDDGIEIVRPQGSRWDGPGQYRLADERLAEALRGVDRRPRGR